MNGTPVEITFIIDGPKITAYLLNESSERGASKAKYLKRFGFTVSEPKVLADALAAHAMVNQPGTPQLQPVGAHRVRYDGRVRAPDGRDMQLSTVWEALFRDGEHIMRFITAFP